MKAKQKTKWLRSADYLAWVRTLPSAVSGEYGCHAQHFCGHGNRGSTKVHDFWTFPLTGNEHNLGVGSLHSAPETCEEKHGSQWEHVAGTLQFALREGIIDYVEPQIVDDELSGCYSADQYSYFFVQLIERGFLKLNKKAALGMENIL
jgi:Protein of unknown function (DUF968)